MVRGDKAAGPKTERAIASGTASIVVLRPLLACARARGVNVEEILASIGLTPSALDEYDRRIPLENRHRAWAMAVARSRDPAFGLHVAEHAEVGAYDVLDYSMSLSATYGEALDHFRRFYRLLSDGWELTLDASGTHARLRCCEEPRHEVECVFAVLVRRGRALTGKPDMAPHEVRFAHDAPADTSPHAAIFRSRVRFGCAVPELLFAHSTLALPVKTANAGLNQILERYMGDLLARLPAGETDETYVERARAAVAHTLVAGRPTLEATARRLHASPRTHQRRLGEHGTSHVEVVDSVRRALAERLVAEGRMSITEIAFLLGFADVSGFRRVYKRWTGHAPSRGRTNA